MKITPLINDLTDEEMTHDTSGIESRSGMKNSSYAVVSNFTQLPPRVSTSDDHTTISSIQDEEVIDHAVEAERVRKQFRKYGEIMNL